MDEKEPIHLPQVIHPLRKEPMDPLIVPFKREEYKFIIIHSKDVSDTDISLLKEYGKVIIFDPMVYMNIPIQNLIFDYILLDLRRKEDRYYLQQIDESLYEQLHIVSLCYTFEKFDDIHEEIGVKNIISKMPPKQAFKADFDRLLLQKKLGKPRPVLSLFKSFLRLVKGDWK